MSEIKLRPYQVQAIQMLNETIRQGHKKIVWCLPTGAGKCLGKDTPVLLHTGKVKKVQDVLMSNKLMGIDNEPREIENLVRGFGKMYRITPVKGDSFQCNDDHILSLVCNGRKSRYKYGEIVNIKLSEYLELPKSVKHVLKLYRKGVEYNERELLIEPYFLGLWLGDGHKDSPRITTADFEVKEYLKSYANKLKLQYSELSTGYQGSAVICRITKGTKFGRAKYNLQSVLRKYDLLDNKHIPEDYLINSESNRLELLAGLLDSDGHLTKNYFEFTSKIKSLAYQVSDLARSLGFQANAKSKYNKKYDTTYYRINICGEVSKIPTKIARKKAHKRKQIKDVLRTGFAVEYLGLGEYYGFSLKGKDKLFLLGDFTVTHNSTLTSKYVKTCIKHNKRVLFFVHRKELVIQFAQRLMNQFSVFCGVIMAGVKPDRTQLVQVASIQTLARREVPKADIIFIDEAHHAKAASYQKVVRQFPNAILVGLTATPFRTDGKGLDDIFDTIVHPIKVNQLIKQGYLVPTKCYAPEESIDLDGIRTVRGDYDEKELYDRFSDTGIVKGVIDNYLKFAKGKQAIVFNVNVVHSKETCERFVNAGISCAHIDAKTPKSERERLTNQFARGIIKVLCNVAIFTEGYDVPAVECVILNRATKSLGLYIQMCLDLNTEILTKDGWKKYNEVKIGDKIYSYDNLNCKIVDDEILSYVLRDKQVWENMATIKGQLCDVRTSEYHDLLVKSKKQKNYIKQTAIQAKLLRTDFFEIPASGIYNENEGVPLSDDELRFIGWFMSDGTINKKTNQITIYQSENQPKYLHESIVSCIEGCGFKYTIYKIPRKGELSKYADILRYCVNKGTPRGRDKHLTGWEKLEPYIDKNLSESLFNISKSQLLTMLETWNYGDGRKSKVDYNRRTMTIAIGDNEILADRLQALCVIKGLRCSKYRRDYNKNPLFELMIKDTTRLVIAGNKIKGNRTRIVIEDEWKEEKLWCVRTVRGTIITRRNGKVSIMGNCGRGLRPSEGKEHCIVLDHGENVIRHGFIRDYDGMNFDLKGIKKKKRRKKEDGEEKGKQCPECYVVNDKYSKVCDSCGFQFPVKERKITFMDGSEFKAIGREAVIIERLLNAKYKQIVGRMPLSQLRIYEIVKGFKKGWFFHAAIDNYLKDEIDKEDPRAWQQVKFRLELEEQEAETFELFKRLNKQRDKFQRKNRSSLSKEYI